MIRNRLPALLLLAAAALAPSLAAGTQVNRCTAPDGTSVYTDRDCSTLGAVERLPRDRRFDDSGAPAAPTRAFAYRGCARSVAQLIQELTAAIDARDVNHLAAFYHWPGISSRAGHGLMERLERIARQPVLDIVPVGSAARSVAQPDSAPGFASLPVSRSPLPAHRGPPVALRVHQAVGQEAAPARTVFALRQHLDCWWISL